MMNLASRLKVARKHAKLSQVQLAEKLKGLMTQQNISLLESGTTSGTEYIVQLAVACNVCPIWLATGEGEMIVSYPGYDQFTTEALKVMQLMDETTKYQFIQIGYTLAEPKKDKGTEQ